MLQNTITFIAIINIDADLLRGGNKCPESVRHRYVAEHASIPTRVQTTWLECLIEIGPQSILL